MAAAHLGDVEAEAAFGDVRERQVGDTVRCSTLSSSLCRAVAAVDLEEHVAVAEHHALGVPGGAGGVEDRDRVLGVDRRHPTGDLVLVGGPQLATARQQRRPGQGAVEVWRGGRVEDDQGDAGVGDPGVGPARHVVGGLEDDDRRTGVPRDVGHLVGGQGVVDRHRHRAGVHGRDVGQDVLEPVRGHDRDPVTGAYAEVHQRRRDVERGLAQLAPGQRAPAGAVPAVGHGLVGEGGGVAVDLHGLGQGVGDGAPRDRLLDVVTVGLDGCGELAHEPHPAVDQSPRLRPMISFWISVVPP